MRRLQWVLPAQLLLLFVCVHACGATAKYDDFATLAEAARVAEGGDTLVFKSGKYTIEQAVTFAAGEGGKPGRPVTICAEKAGSVVLEGNSTAFAFKLGAANVIVSGFVFKVQDETAVKLDGANHVRITRCEFRLRETDSFDWLVITGKGSHHNRVDRCRFAGKRHPGNYITIDGDSAGQQSQYDRIDHNHFCDIRPRAKNEKEAIRVGWSEVSLSSGFTVLEHNYFERCDGDPEIISIKSCDNTVRCNTIVDSMGVLSLRHGNRNTVHSNVILGKKRPGCGGIRIYGEDHRIYNNYLAHLTGERFDAALALTNGDMDNARPGTRLDAHFRPRRIEIVNNSLIDNTHSIEIGYPHLGKDPWRKSAARNPAGQQFGDRSPERTGEDLHGTRELFVEKQSILAEEIRQPRADRCRWSIQRPCRSAIAFGRCLSDSCSKWARLQCWAAHYV